MHDGRIRETQVDGGPDLPEGWREQLGTVIRSVLITASMVIGMLLLKGIAKLFFQWISQPNVPA